MEAKGSSGAMWVNPTAVVWYLDWRSPTCVHPQWAHHFHYPEDALQKKWGLLGQRKMWSKSTNASTFKKGENHCWVIAKSPVSPGSSIRLLCLYPITVQDTVLMLITLRQGGGLHSPLSHAGIQSGSSNTCQGREATSQGETLRQPSWQDDCSQASPASSFVEKMHGFPSGLCHRL